MTAAVFSFFVKTAAFVVLLSILVTLYVHPNFFNTKLDFHMRTGDDDIHVATKTNITEYQKRKMKLTLPNKVMNGIKKFVFFVGYPRSGHSIISSLMDAHPHVIITTNYCYTFREFLESPKRKSRETLYNSLYAESAQDKRMSFKKGYSLKVDGLWQGEYDGYLEVIGDRCGGRTTNKYIEIFSNKL